MNPWTPWLLSVLGWGASNVLSKAVLNRGVDTFSYLPARYLVGVVALVGFLASTGRLGWSGWRVWRLGAVLGALNMAVPTIFMTRGIEYIPVTMGSLLIALIPIATVAAAHFVVPGERFNPKILPGFLVSLSGVVILVGGGAVTVATTTQLITGVVLTLIGVALAGLGGAVARRFTLKVAPNRLVLPQFAAGLLVLVISLFLVGEGAVPQFDEQLWWLVLAAGTVGTAVPFAAFLYAAEVNPASRLAATGYAVPILATVGAVAFLGEEFTALMVVGAVLILGGVYLSERAARYTPPPVSASSP